MQFSDNGTYACDVKNPPDIEVMPARTQLRVVMKGKSAVFSTVSWSRLKVWASVIGLIQGSLALSRDPGEPGYLCRV
uniref:Ig-like domain-containing protein n=1 Tax=Anguilla anguilla TaxID=7936 RepID=A0A0E9XAU4_ANGAN